MPHCGDTSVMTMIVHIIVNNSAQGSAGIRPDSGISILYAESDATII